MAAIYFSERRRWQLKWAAAVAASLSSILLHVAFLLNAGGLWRDEANTVTLATLPSFQQIWQNLPHESFPLLSLILIRAWGEIGLGKTDFELRLLGFCVGLLLLASFWFASRTMRRGLPLLPLLLVAANAVAIRAGDSLRGYGLGSVLDVLLLALIFRAAQQPTIKRLAWAALVALAAVNSLFQNAFLIAAAIGAGVVLCLSERRRRDVPRIIAIGLIPAVSLIPYIPAILRTQDVWILEKSGFSLGSGFRTFSVMLGFPWPVCKWLFVGLCLGGIGITVANIRKTSTDCDRALILFSGCALVFGIIGFGFFLENAHLPTKYWYYLPLLAYLAVCLDCLLSAYCAKFAPLPCSAMVMIACVAVTWKGLPIAQIRQTNVDLVARQLALKARPGDYIIIKPWYWGVSFNYYYHGAAEWTTIPPLADHSLHRYDLFRAKMMEKNPNQEVFDKLAAALQNGHRVWVMGALGYSRDDPPKINPAPNNPWGWVDENYTTIWGQQVGHYLALHAVQGTKLNPLTSSPVSIYEDLPACVFWGWQD